MRSGRAQNTKLLGGASAAPGGCHHVQLLCRAHLPAEALSLASSCFLRLALIPCFLVPYSRSEWASSGQCRRLKTGCKNTRLIVQPPAPVFAHGDPGLLPPSCSPRSSHAASSRQQKQKWCGRSKGCAGTIHRLRAFAHHPQPGRPQPGSLDIAINGAHDMQDSNPHSCFSEQAAPPLRRWR